MRSNRNLKAKEYIHDIPDRLPHVGLRLDGVLLRATAQATDHSLTRHFPNRSSPKSNTKTTANTPASQYLHDVPHGLLHVGRRQGDGGLEVPLPRLAHGRGDAIFAGVDVLPVGVAYGGLERIVSNKQHLRGIGMEMAACRRRIRGKKDRDNCLRHMEALTASSATSSACRTGRWEGGGSMPAASEPKETGRDKDSPRMEALIASSATNSTCRVLGLQGREAAHGLRVSAREQQERQRQTELAAYGGLDGIVSNKQHLQGMRVGGE